MPLFTYTARTLKGDLVNDKIDLPTRDDVIAHLRKNRLVVVQVRAAPKEFKFSFKLGGGVKIRDVVVFTRQFSTDRKSTRLNSSHSQISYAVFCLKKKKRLSRHLRYSIGPD